MDDIADLISKNKNLIYKIASYYADANNLEDLFQVGCIGMIKAYKNYDKSKNTKFTSFAYIYIMGEMKEYLRTNRNIKLSKDMLKLSLKIEKVRILLTQKMMREPSTYELATYLELPHDIVIDAFLNLNSVSLDKENEAGDLYDIIPSKNYNYEDFIMLMDEIDSLKEPDRTIIIQRYLQDHTQSEVAQNLGLNQVFVSRTEAKALKLIKSRAA